MFSQITLIGNVGALPEVNQLPSGGQVAKFRLAVNETWKDRDGNKQSRTDWFTIVCFQNGETGIISSVMPLIRKGMPVMVVAKPQQRQWTANDGTNRTTFEVRIGPNDTIRLLGAKPANGHDAEAPGAPTVGRRAEEPPFNDDIPFGS